MPLNTPADVARYIIQVTAEPQTHGKALFVTGGNAVDIEEGLAATQPQWLGENNSREFNLGQEILGLVSLVFRSSSLSGCVRLVVGSNGTWLSAAPSL